MIGLVLTAASHGRMMKDRHPLLRLSTEALVGFSPMHTSVEVMNCAMVAAVENACIQCYSRAMSTRLVLRHSLTFSALKWETIFDII